MWEHNDYPTLEEQDAMCQQQSHLEIGLWTDWVGVVCDWEKIPHPTQEEWVQLRSNFYSGKAPIDSVGELKKMRVKE